MGPSSMISVQYARGGTCSLPSCCADGSQLVVNAVYTKAIHFWDLRAIGHRPKAMYLDWDRPELPADP